MLFPSEFRNPLLFLLGGRWKVYVPARHVRFSNNSKPTRVHGGTEDGGQVSLEPVHGEGPRCDR